MTVRLQCFKAHSPTNEICRTRKEERAVFLLSVMVLAGDRFIHPAVGTPVRSAGLGSTSGIRSGVGLETRLGPTRDRRPAWLVLAFAIRADVVLLVSLGDVFPNLLLRRFVHGFCRRFGCRWCHLLLGPTAKAKESSPTLALLFVGVVAATAHRCCSSFTLAGAIVDVVIDKGVNLLDFLHIRCYIEKHFGEVGTSVLVTVLSVIGRIIGLQHPLPDLQQPFQEERPATPSRDGIGHRGLSTAALLGNALERPAEDEEGDDGSHGAGEDDDSEQDAIFLCSGHVLQAEGAEEIVEGGHRGQDGTERILELVEVVRLGVDWGGHVVREVSRIMTVGKKSDGFGNGFGDRLQDTD
mmetsp:Transcript_21316/g.61158  ORF Transcript_21316/g.61158 Transcript_21316/m.61158 type:complete len:353 (-) Transcript_21316:131-1189(-)